MTTSLPDPVASTGKPFPLGATPCEDGSINFAIASQHAETVTLCLFADPETPWRETHHFEVTDRHGDTRFISLKGIPEGSRYGYRASGPWKPEQGHLYNPAKLLLDPYAKHIDGPSKYAASMKSIRKNLSLSTADSVIHAPRAFVPKLDLYDWEGDTHPRIPMTESVICELHVKGFSKLNEAIPAPLRGTYAGLAHPASLTYLKELGITTVQLLPVHQHLDDGFLLERGLVNYWGYNTIGFFAPEARYATNEDPITEFRDMVKAFHREGMEVILDVVYNHTGEAGIDGPTCMLRGLDNLCYYHNVPTKPGVYWDSTGCGNSVDLSHPRALRFVMDSLRYWVEEMHVDGFRFDLAVELGRSPLNFDRRSAFFQALQQDPVLSQTKLIAEPWDLGPDGYQIGNFPTQWAELNGRFRDDVRRFWRGEPKVMGEFASRITGSEALFAHNRRTPGHSLNLITSHDGFTLNDLVSYEEKHNLANGEGNRDGDSHNLSSNHGIEGPTDDPSINSIRLRQIRNFLTTLICSQGVPFLMAGDERLRSQHGNNNTYCQDNELSWISWEETDSSREMREFTSRLFQFRREHPNLRRTSFFTGKIDSETGLHDVCWLRPDGEIKQSADWNGKKPGAFAMLVNGQGEEKALVFFFNAKSKPMTFHFPQSPDCSWKLVIDTESPNSSPRKGKPGKSLELCAHGLQVWEEV
ncbi:MAG: glycogen debranching protein GlgX [Verrucomicrobiales bacterium]|nr:glycogen debranching protein GlgX [Verrucomicrobiales bacterium]